MAQSVRLLQDEKFFDLPDEMKGRIFGLMEEMMPNEMMRKEECCDFKRSLNMTRRREITGKYFALKKDLLERGMVETDSILLHLRSVHQSYQQKFFAADFMVMQLDMKHMYFGIECDEGPSTSGCTGGELKGNENK